MPKSKRSKACEFSTKERKAINERDQGRCIFCGSTYGLQVMHFIQRSKSGLGIRQNAALGCIQCHTMLDNSVSRKSMLGVFRKYLDYHYPEFPDEERVYKKWQ